MDSDLEIKKDPGFLNCLPGLRESQIATTDTECQHQISNMNSSLLERVKNLRYGIFLFYRSFNKTLFEDDLIEKYNCDEVFIPKALEEPYNIAFFFYESLQNRDENFHFNHKRLLIDFQVSDLNIPKNKIITNFFNAVENMCKSSSKEKEINFKNILRLSHKLITDIILNVIEAFEEFKKTLYPSRTSLWYFMLFNFYIFINKQWHYINFRKGKRLINFLEIKNYFQNSLQYQTLTHTFASI